MVAQSLSKVFSKQEDDVSVAKSTVSVQSLKSILSVKPSAEIPSIKEDDVVVAIEHGQEEVEMINESSIDDAASKKSKRSIASKKSIAASVKAANSVLSKLEEHAEEVLN
jgi:hypothetical protein